METNPPDEIAASGVEGIDHVRRCRDLSIENARLAALCWASQRLHQSVTWYGLLEAIEEIGLRVVEAQRVLVYEAHWESPRLVGPREALGSAPVLALGVEAIVHDVIATGLPFIEHAGLHEAPRAVLPLAFGGRAVGAVAMIGAGVVSCGARTIDPELIDLVSNQGGLIFFCTARDAARPTWPVPGMRRACAQ